MKPKISVVSLGVKDLEKSVRFYRDGLGLPLMEGYDGKIAFFMLDGTWLSLYPHDALAEDAGAKLEPCTAPTGFVLAHNVSSEAEVAPVLAAAEKAGGTIIKTAQRAFWGGFHGYFRDPDGFLWEVAYNPFFDLS